MRSQQEGVSTETAPLFSRCPSCLADIEDLRLPVTICFEQSRIPPFRTENMDAGCQDASGYLYLPPCVSTFMVPTTGWIRATSSHQ